MSKLERTTKRFAALLIVTAAFALGSAAGCSKTNDINAGPGSGSGSCNDQPCSGACVEGACRSYCDENYECPGDGVCVDVESVAVCLPPGALVYEPYQPFDMLSECTSSECQVPLDAPALEGVLRRCSGSAYTVDDVPDPDFDFESACATLSDYSYTLLQGRKLYDVSDGSCLWAHAGAGPADSLIRYTCDNALNYDTYEEEFKVDADFWRVVELEGETYIWRSNASPFDARHVPPELYKLTDESVSPPTKCDFGTYARSNLRPEECALPIYPRTGGPLPSQFEGLWIACDSMDLRACEEGWDGPDLNASRPALYINAQRFGQFWLSDVSAAETRPTECNAAFRGAMIVARSAPIGAVSVTPHQLLDILEVPEGVTGNDGRSLPSGRYIVRTENLTYFKQVPLPEDFVDPCEGSAPNLTW